MVMNYSRFKLQKAIRSFFQIFSPAEAFQTSVNLCDFLLKKGEISEETCTFGVRLATAYHDMLEV